MKCNYNRPKLSKKNTHKQNKSAIVPNNNLTKSFFPLLLLKVNPCQAISPVIKTNKISIYDCFNTFF